MMNDVDWDKGLPVEVLSMVAGGSDALKAMRGVRSLAFLAERESCCCIHNFSWTSSSHSLLVLKCLTQYADRQCHYFWF